MNRFRSRDGFTLIEATVALGLFAALLVGVPSLIVGGVRANRNALQTSAAAVIAQDKLEELRNTAFAAITTNSTGETRSDGTNGATYLRRWIVTNDTPVVGTKTVAVTVTWQDLGTRSISLATVFAP